MENILGYIDVQLLISVSIKLVLILVLGSIIGFQREAYNKPAGLRTHVLVGISAVLVMVCGKFMHEETGADSTRIPAQLLSGIGFLGAGTIIRNGYSVRGLTTAASLLAMTCIGMAVGAGMYLVGLVSTVIAFIVLEYTKSLGNKIEHFDPLKICLEVTNAKDRLKQIREVLDIYGFEADEIKIDKENSILLIGRIPDDFDKNRVFYKLMQIEDVFKVSEEKDL